MAWSHKFLKIDFSLHQRNIVPKYIGNKAKGRISKRAFQENKARQIFRKTKPFCLITDEYILQMKRDIHFHWSQMLKNPVFDEELKIRYQQFLILLYSS